MPEELPKYIDTRRLAGLTEAFSGSVAAARLHRIGAPYAAIKPVAVEMEIRSDDNHRPHVIGQVKTEIKATCQRCLGDMDVAIEKKFDLVLIDASESPVPAIEAADDVLTITQGKIDIDQLVEDEVILSCPMIPVHDGAGCRAAPKGNGGPDGDRKKPFAGLADLMAGTVNQEDSER
jgi:uncharacterized protein